MEVKPSFIYRDRDACMCVYILVYCILYNIYSEEQGIQGEVKWGKVERKCFCGSFAVPFHPYFHKCSTFINNFGGKSFEKREKQSIPSCPEG